MSVTGTTENHHPNSEPDAKVHHRTGSSHPGHSAFLSQAASLAVSSLSLDSDSIATADSLKSLRAHGDVIKQLSESASQAASSVVTSSSSYEPASPRARFLAGCLARGLAPRSAIVLRSKLTTELNLAHQGMGDEFAELLAYGLNSIPALEILNIADNNLTDSGLKPLIDSIAANPNIVELNVSGNVIGPLASSALAEYLGRPQCLLKSLILEAADVDDSECNRIVESLMGNRHLEVGVDISSPSSDHLINISFHFHWNYTVVGFVTEQAREGRELECG